MAESWTGDANRWEPTTRRETRFGRAERIPRSDAASERARRLRRLDRLAWLLDRSIPIGKWRVGLDPIIGLVPGAGDWIGAIISLYIVYEGARLGVPANVLMRMGGNVLVESVVGAVPVLGDVFDAAWKANTRNMALIRQHYNPARDARSLRWVWTLVLIIALLVLTAVGLLAYLFFKGVIELLERIGG